MNKTNSIIGSILLLMSLAAYSQILPKKIEIIVPYGAGGASDGAARHFQTWAINQKNYDVVVVNKPGAQGSIATNDLFRSAKDGSVISFTAAGVIVMAEERAGKRLAEPITTTGITVQAIIANPNSKYQTLKDFEAGIKTAPEDFTMGWFAVGNLSVLNQIQKNLNSNKEFLRVPFKTSTDTAQNVVGGHINLGIVPMAVAKPMIDDGKLKLVVAVAHKEFQLPKEMPSITKRFPNWTHQDGFMVALPFGVSNQVEEAWLVLLKEYFDQRETQNFYQENYLARTTFGKTSAVELINNARESLKKLEVQIK